MTASHPRMETRVEPELGAIAFDAAGPGALLERIVEQPRECGVAA